MRSFSAKNGSSVAVVDRPVIGDAVQRPHAEIRWMHAREMRRVEHRAAADAVEVGDLHRRVVVVDRVIGWPGAPVRADVEIAVAPRLPVPAVAGEVGLLHPVALLQAEDFHPRLGQAPGHRGAGRAGADDQDVDDFVAGAVILDCLPARRATFSGGLARVQQRPIALFQRVAFREWRPWFQPQGAACTRSSR